MPQILAELDPHSTYIPAQNLEEVNSELEGSFSGIGIQFTIQNDTIHVNAVIQGGSRIPGSGSCPRSGRDRPPEKQMHIWHFCPSRCTECSPIFHTAG